MEVIAAYFKKYTEHLDSAVFQYLLERVKTLFVVTAMTPYSTQVHRFVQALMISTSTFIGSWTLFES